MPNSVKDKIVRIFENKPLIPKYSVDKNLIKKLRAIKLNSNVKTWHINATEALSMDLEKLLFIMLHIQVTMPKDHLSPFHIIGRYVII